MTISTSSRYRWLVALKGLTSFIFGIIVLAFPIETTEFILIYLGVLIALGGLFVLGFAFKNLNFPFRKGFILEGIFDILIAAILIFYPVKSAFFIVILFGVWLLISALFQLNIALRRKKIGEDYGMLLANGLLTLLLSIVGITVPLSGVLTFAYLLGVTSTLFGAFLMLTATLWWRKEKVIY